MGGGAEGHFDGWISCSVGQHHLPGRREEVFPEVVSHTP